MKRTGEETGSTELKTVILVLTDNFRNMQATAPPKCECNRQTCVPYLRTATIKTAVPPYVKKCEVKLTWLNDIDLQLSSFKGELPQVSRGSSKACRQSNLGPMESRVNAFLGMWRCASFAI